jgi:hypothetical protein
MPETPEQKLARELKEAAKKVKVKPALKKIKKRTEKK